MSETMKKLHTNRLRYMPAKLSLLDRDNLRAAACHIEALEARAEKAEAERDALRDVAKQAIDVIESVQTYPQPDDPTEENALTMREHEVFGFDVESARAALNREAGT